MMRKFPRLALTAAGLVALGLAGAVHADERGGSTGARGSAIKSRGADAAHADLMRDWNYKGADQGRSISLRNEAELNADLVRDWTGPRKGSESQARQAPHSRAADSAYDDLMRNWGG